MCQSYLNLFGFFFFQLKLTCRLSFNFKVISVTLQQAVFFGDRSTGHPVQSHPCPWGLWRWHSLAGCERAEGWAGLGAAGRSPRLVPGPWGSNPQVPSPCAAALRISLPAARTAGQTHPWCGVWADSCFWGKSMTVQASSFSWPLLL